MVTAAEIQRAHRMLESVPFNKPAGVDNLEAVWKFVFEDVTWPVLEEAIKRYVKSEAKYWPKPGELLSICESITGNHLPRYVDPPLPAEPVTKTYFWTELSKHGIDRRKYEGEWRGPERRTPNQGE